MLPKSLGVVLAIVGAVWIMQGLGVARTGSFMDGDRRWALAGGVALVVGLVTALVRRRRPRP